MGGSSSSPKVVSIDKDEGNVVTVCLHSKGQTRLFFLENNFGQMFLGNHTVKLVVHFMTNFHPLIQICFQKSPPAFPQKSLTLLYFVICLVFFTQLRYTILKSDHKLRFYPPPPFHPNASTNPIFLINLTVNF